MMPRLDGASATSLIRKFDPKTPIISMTSNSKPDDVLFYLSQGMNDILPKPVTQEGLFGMLEKHLIHLKSIHNLRRTIPRSLGIHPLNDANFEQALAVGHQQRLVHASQQAEQQSEEGNARMNILAGMGVSDEHYNMLLQGMAPPAAQQQQVNGNMSQQPPTHIPFIDFGLGVGGVLIEKRPLDDPQDREAKRSRFEIIE
jgi:osomolarity two-component system response regulator SKN7